MRQSTKVDNVVEVAQKDHTEPGPGSVYEATSKYTSRTFLCMLVKVGIDNYRMINLETGNRTEDKNIKPHDIPGNYRRILPPFKMRMEIHR